MPHALSVPPQPEPNNRGGQCLGEMSPQIRLSGQHSPSPKMCSDPLLTFPYEGAEARARGCDAQIDTAWLRAWAQLEGRWPSQGPLLRSVLVPHPSSPTLLPFSPPLSFPLSVPSALGFLDWLHSSWTATEAAVVSFKDAAFCPFSPQHSLLPHLSLLTSLLGSH